jgi:CheY-like chemotaxis protein
VFAVHGELIFTVKIADAAKRAGIMIEFAKSAEETLERAAGASAIMLDLNFAPPEWIVRLKSEDSTRSIPLIGFVSHVQSEVIRQVRESGCDTVMARSAFVQKLSEMMAEIAAGKP